MTWYILLHYRITNNSKDASVTYDIEEEMISTMIETTNDIFVTVKYTAAIVSVTIIISNLMIIVRDFYGALAIVISASVITRIILLCITVILAKKIPALLVAVARIIIIVTFNIIILIISIVVIFLLTL